MKKNSVVSVEKNALKFSGWVRSKSEHFWKTQGEVRALALFKKAVASIPAYKNFLKKHRVNPSTIRTIKDFAKIPETSKENYINKYSPSERSPYGTFSNHKIIAMSSGTTGTPTFWPRGAEQEAEAGAVHEFLFTDLYEIEKSRTLAVGGFPI